jgi:hypothetical protein
MNKDKNVKLKLFIVFFLMALDTYAQGTIEYELHNRKIDDKILLNDFLLLKNGDAYWDLEARITNISQSHLAWVKLRTNFYNNKTIVDSQVYYLDYDTYDYYGMLPGSIGLIASLKSKLLFDSLNFVITYDIDSGLGYKLNENTLSLLNTNFLILSYSDKYHKWVGSIKNISQSPIKFPKILCCFFRNGLLLHIDACYVDVQNNTINAGETCFFDHLLIVPSGNDSILYLTHYSIGLTGSIVSSVETNHFPFSLDLSQNYPNPFNASTSIHYSISKPGIAVLFIFNSNGRMIFEAFRQTMMPGDYFFNLDLSSYPSGIYLYRLTIDKIALTKKMNYIK